MARALSIWNALMPAVLLAAFQALGQEDVRSLNWFNLAYRAGFNITASFKDLQQSGPANDPLTYDREIGRVWKLSWGFELPANSTAINISETHNALGSVSLWTDRYSLGGIPPAAPFFGSFQGSYPNRPVISDVPVRNLQPRIMSAWRPLDADRYGFRLGPHIELPMSDQFSAGLSGGLALAVTDSRLKYSETITGAGIGRTLFRAGEKSTDGLFWGGFVNGTFTFQASHAWSLFVGGEFQDLESFTQNSSNREVKLDLGKSIYVMAGLGYSF